MERDPATGWKPGKPSVLLNTPRVEAESAFSPDGRWLAYSSNESGSFEVYVRAFPAGGQWQVSTNGGRFPVWSPTEKQLFYRGVDLKLMVAAYAIEGGSFRAGRPRIWSTRLDERGPSRTFDLHPDGRRFAVLKSLASSEAKLTHVTFIFNFADELRWIAPAGKR